MNCECEDGLIFREVPGRYARVMYRCPCPKGEKHAQDRFSVTDKEHERPYKLPVWREVRSGRDRAAEPEREKNAS